MPARTYACMPQSAVNDPLLEWRRLTFSAAASVRQLWFAVYFNSW